jgi:hypothetical protein
LALDPAQITVAAKGAIYAAPYPGDAGLDALVPIDSEAAMNVAFKDLGYATEDGVTFTATPEVEDIPAWQSATPVRRLTTARELTVATSLEQWNQDTFKVAFGGGSWTVTGTAPNQDFRYDPPADEDPLGESVVCVEAIDGVKRARWVVYKCNITEAVETQLVRTAAALLPVTFNALTPGNKTRSWHFLSNDQEFAPGA